MIRFLVLRLLGLVPMLIGITLVSFLVIQLAPGEPVQTLTDLNPKASAEAYAKLRDFYGLNEPLHIQYWQWLKNIAQLNFGTSFSPDGRPVLDKILEALPVTLAMNIIGLIMVLIIALPLGIKAAWAPNSLFDKSTTLGVFILFAAPSFWVALLAMMLFGNILGWLPISGMSSFGSENWPLYERIIDWAWHLLLPVTIGVLGSLAGISRYMRSSMLEAAGQDYITTARAKGLAEKQVQKHAIKNALLPVITILGLSIPGLIGGSVITESIFAIPGMGKLFYDGVLMRDYPLIMGILTLGALLTLLGNLIADVAYGLVDPRVRVK